MVNNIFLTPEIVINISQNILLYSNPANITNNRSKIAFSIVYCLDLSQNSNKYYNFIKSSGAY